jgi:outer membrane protein assembly factor BamB
VPRSATALLALCLCPLASRADNWPGWRGPTGDGISAEKGLPVSWSPTHNVRWKVELPGAGVSAPVVWGEHVFLTASTGRLNDELHVLCHRRGDGRQLWHVRLFGTSPTDLYPPGGMAVPTPATDGERLYTLFGTGDLVCLDFAGKPVWIRSLAQEYGPFRNRWGMSASPVLIGDRLLVQVDHWSQSYLLAADARTGATRWKKDRDAAVNWSTPLPVRVKGTPQLVVTGTRKVKGYDLRTGAELWSVGGLDNQCIPTPVAADGLVFLTSGTGTLAVRLDGGPGRDRVAWENKRARAFVPSPLVYEGRLYVPADQDFVTCLDVARGTKLWKERLRGSFHASPVAGDGKVYFPTKEGVVRVLRAGPVFELLGENNLGEMIVASPAIAGGALFLRGEKHLFCIAGPSRARSGAE